MEILLLSVIVIGAIVLFATEVIPIDLSAILIMVLLMLTGLVTPQEGVSGFSNPATITILALLIIAAGLQNTGIVNSLGERLGRLFPKDEWPAILLLMIITAAFSAFLYNSAVVAIFIPLVLRISKSTGISASKLLLPLSFSAIIGGTTTIIGTSTNLIVSSIADNYGFGQFRMFEFTVLGLLFFTALMIYMLTIGRRLIPVRRTQEPLTEQYKIKNYLTEVVIKPDSRLVGRRISQTIFGRGQGPAIIEIIRDEHSLLAEEIEMLRAEDKLIIKGDPGDISNISNQEGISIMEDMKIGDEELSKDDLVLMEVIIGPSSKLQDKDFDPVKFRRKFNSIPLAIRKSGEIRSSGLTGIRLRFGDAFLIETTRDNIQDIHESNDLLILQEHEGVGLRTGKLRIGLAITAAVVLLASFEILPILTSALAGATAMMVTGCISINKAYQQVDWKIIFLLAGVLPLGIAIEKHGVGSFIAGYLVNIIEHTGPHTAIGFLFILTALLTSIISNNATAVLLAPIAISTAAGLGLDPKPFLVTIMFAASTSFLTPIGYQTNAMIYSVGNYKFTDFTKVGGVYTLIIWILATIFIPLLYMG